MRVLIGCAASAMLVSAVLAGSGQAVTLRVEHRARALQPGEVVRLIVTAATPLGAISGEAFGRPIRFYPAAASTVHEALLGIGLNTPPGIHAVTITAVSEGGVRGGTTYRLRVVAKDFGVRRISVAEAFVTPPARELDRIARETATVNRLFAGVTAERFADGAFVAPVPGVAVSSFGRRSIVNGQARSRHLGGDFRAAAGEPVRAPNAGRIVLVGAHYFAGNVVIVDHGLGVYSYFAHLSTAAVAEGDQVRRGDVVGRVGQTGRVTGPHLHWAVSVANTRVDPLSLVAATAPGPGSQGGP